MAAAADHREDSEAAVALFLTRWLFVLVWWLVLAFHAACAAFLIATTLMYRFVASFPMIYYNKLLGSTLRKDMESLGFVFVGMAAVHGLEMLRMIAISLYYRELLLNAPHAHSAPAAARALVVPTLPNDAAGNVPTINKTPLALRKLRSSRGVPQRLLPRGLLRVLRRSTALRLVAVPFRLAGRGLRRLKFRLLDRKHGLLGIESPYFNVLFLFREGLEIASQSYQMYQCSRLLARPWLNVLFLALTVVNCWTTPILQHALARYNALERVICLVLDGLLDAGTCMILPLLIVVKYVRAFDPALGAFPTEYLTDPAWFTGLVLENRLLFAMDRTDLVSKLVPHYSLFGCIRKAKTLLFRMPPEMDHDRGVTYVATTATATNGDDDDAAMAMATAAAHRDRVQSRSRGSFVDNTARTATATGPGWRRRFVHVFFIGWGITVLVVHLRARQVANWYAGNTACKQQLRPWFRTSFMCATFEFDCVEQGHAATLTAADLTPLDPGPLSALIIANCPALVMPPELQNFPGLLKFMIYNSTIVQWPANASLNGVSHAALISISVVASSMSGLPAGLQEALPGTLQDLQFAQTDLAALPADIATKWPPMTKLYLEYGAFDEFPAQILNVRCDELSFVGNNLSVLPDAFATAAWGFQDLALGANPHLTGLPVSGFVWQLTTLSVENTGFTAFPSSVISATSGRGMAGGDLPLLARALTTSTSDPSSSTGSSTGAGSSGTGSGAGPASSVAVYAFNTPYCQGLGGESEADRALANGSLTLGESEGTHVFCATRDPNGVARFPLAWTVERFRPRIG